jgi:hypothetical protein
MWITNVVIFSQITFKTSQVLVGWRDLARYWWVGGFAQSIAAATQNQFY